jgi:phosphomannomutase/phosphoglucomutase
VSAIPDNIFREYDIRGVYGADLTDETAELIGRGYAIYLRGRGVEDPITVSIGRDVRLSSNAVFDALVKGLTESGVNCIDIGECPTPLQYFSMFTMDVQGGVMITGSHNPPEYNGLKISVGRETIHGEEIQALKGVIRDKVLSGSPPVFSGEKGTIKAMEIIPGYIDDVSARFTLPDTKKPVKVVLDSGNGTAGAVAPELLKRIGCEVVELYSEPDGNFPNHHPDPTLEKNLKDLISTVKAEGADFGIAYDGDADRIGVVDELGGVIWGDKLMIIFARAILEGSPGATIVGEVKCSQVMYDEIRKQGGKAEMWKTGHSLIKARMKELKAAMAGEMSGHIFFADKWFGFDDAVYASCRLVEIMAARRAANPAFAFSTLLKGLPETFITPELRVECADDLKFGMIEKLDKVLGDGVEGLKITDVIRIDGLRINFDGGWALVRASNTQPVLVLRFEANDKALLERARAFMRAKLEEVAPGAGAGI